MYVRKGLNNILIVFPQQARAFVPTTLAATVSKQCGKTEEVKKE